MCQGSQQSGQTPVLNVCCVQEMTVVYNINEPWLKYNTKERSLCFSFLSSSRDLGVQEMTVVYNITNEPWLKYNMAAIADRGLKPSQWTSARFQTQVLLVETARYFCSSSCAQGNCQLHVLFFLNSLLFFSACGDCQVHVLFFLCLWQLSGTSALLFVFLEDARYICSSSCIFEDCQVHLLSLFCFDGVGCLLLGACSAH